ncbi:CONSTANS-like protein [Quillaja saponaria]|uniref:CONSTANS-like protein n=1 Tax=Quillaja saponaria TaxID=32244 RepID=A0AAD7QDY0_QUISA|nr:CONSTANS-like protein [Quillaja saponaria]
MGIERGNLKGISGGWTVASKPCDSCKSAVAAVFCRPDSAFLCITCDTKIHFTNKFSSPHERVWMCEVCEQAPASVTCKADAATLCVTCDSDIHSANPLARRHERVPVEPFFDSAESIVKSSDAFSFMLPTDNAIIGSDTVQNNEVETEAGSWLIPNPNFNSKIMDGPEIKPGDMFFSEMDSFMDFDYPNSIETRFQKNHHDSIVPVQTKRTPPPVANHSSEICFDIDFCRSKLSSLSYPSQSLSQSVSSSSPEVGVVPDGNSMSEISYPFRQNMSNGSDSSGNGSGNTKQPTQLCGMDREARVLRYREKRKNRKFEKTIRYASRKAYAETRPRIKGRFAKRAEIESDVDPLYSSVATSAGLMAGSQYGVVPTF